MNRITTLAAWADATPDWFVWALLIAISIGSLLVVWGIYRLMKFIFPTIDESLFKKKNERDE